MTRQTDEKRQEWHGYLRKYGKRPEDAAGTLGGKGGCWGKETTKNGSKQTKPKEDWIKNTSQKEK